MTNQYTNYNGVGKDPVTQQGLVIYNAYADSEWSTAQKLKDASECLIGGGNDDEHLQIHKGEILLMLKRRVPTQLSKIKSHGDCSYRVFSSINRAFSRGDRLCDVIDRLDCAGIAGTYTKEDRRGENSKRDLIAQVGGLATVINTGQDYIQTGDILFWDLPASTEEAMLMAGVLDGRPKDKFVPLLRVFDPVHHKMDGYIWKELTTASAYDTQNAPAFQSSSSAGLNNARQRARMNPKGVLSGVSREAADGILTNFLQLMVIMEPMMPFIKAAAAMHASPTTINKNACAKHINDGITQIRNNPQAIIDMSKTATQLIDMCRSNGPAMEILSSMLVPEGDARVMFTSKQPDHLRATPSSAVKHVDEMQEDSFQQLAHFFKYLDRYVSRRKLGKAMKPARHGEETDILIDYGMAP
jgi:hypothetical protein